ncbi:MAG: CPBP family intramembrane glutamic endopeptidase [Owenweeksia sp.]|nr:CPBP family intramembrane glutamic endopeptidase [Owenweeksia sp.]
MFIFGKIDNSQPVVMKGSFSQYSPGMQFLMLVFLGLGGLVFFTAMGTMLASLSYPFSVAELMEGNNGMDPTANADVLKISAGFHQPGHFFSAWPAGGLSFSSEPGRYLGSSHFPNRGGLVIILVVLLALGATTVSDALYRFSSSFEWPEFLGFLKEFSERTEQLLGEQIESFLQMDSFGEFLEVFFILAILPAVGEETLFRGVLQPIFKKWLGNFHLGILLTALCFALLHQQFTTFLSIFALGVVMGYLREWSGSLWVPVLMHLINNGPIVVAAYYWDLSYGQINDLSGEWQIEYAIPGIAVFAVSLLALQQLFKRQRTNGLANT